jgi:hypothetical protein
VLPTTPPVDESDETISRILNGHVRREERRKRDREVTNAERDVAKAEKAAAIAREKLAALRGGQ